MADDPKMHDWMRNFVRIVPPENGGLCAGTRVFQGDVEISEITRIDLRMEPGCYPVAHLSLAAHVPDIYAIPFMSEDAFLMAAKHYGYTVEKADR